MVFISPLILLLMALFFFNLGDVVGLLIVMIGSMPIMFYMGRIYQIRK